MASHFTYTWSPNSSLIEKAEYGEFIASRRFTTVKNHVNYTWYLKLYPKGLKIGEADNHDSLLTCVFFSGPKDVVFVNRQKNMNERNYLPYPAEDARMAKELKQKYQYERDKVNVFEIDSANSGEVSESIFQRPLSFGAILVRLIINDQLFDQFFSLPDIIAPIATSPFDRLLAKVLSGEENKRSDFSIVAENHIYATDSNILAARCPFFEQFFDETGEQWAEKTTKQFSAPFSKRVMDEILSNIYTDRMNIPESTHIEFIRELVSAADYFQLYELKKQYERPLLTCLISNISGIGALSAFIFADRYDFKILKNVSLSMLSEHYDSVEDAVKMQKAAASTCEHEFCFGESEGVLALWNLLKKNRDNHSSLFDELFAFMRQTLAQIADTPQCSASWHSIVL